jgi:hypothetical protein
MSDTETRAREAVGRAIADGMALSDALATLAAGGFEKAGPAVVTRREALDAAAEAREEDVLAAGRRLFDSAQGAEAIIVRDLEALEARTKRKVALNYDDMNRLSRLLVLQQKAGKTLKSIPLNRRNGRRGPNDQERPSATGVPALADEVAGSADAPVSPLAEQIAALAQERGPAVGAANGA